MHRLVREMIWWKTTPDAADLAAEIDAKSRYHSRELGLPAIDARVLDAVARVPREQFVPEEYRAEAYCDEALPIGHRQTISQPSVVAAMTDALALAKTDVVLEVGTGSGYQAAVLTELAAQVYTIELIPELAHLAAARLAALGYGNVEVRCGDGRRGWPEHAPYDAIIVTACADEIPASLEEQLKIGGRLIAPVGKPGEPQWLTRIERRSKKDFASRVLFPVSFVPLRSAS
jgi:protein-L-isoaspartate(D-aspartate) O-methyltransferase